jgi:hypothetical protein
MPTQLQIFYAEQKKIGESNQLFLDLVNDGMTREELQANIKRRPELWGRWENWLPKLPQTSFTYQELTSEAQQHAFETWAQDEPHDNWHECEQECLIEDMKLRGIEIDDVQFSGFYSQGDGASFTGTIDLLHFMNWEHQENPKNSLATNYTEVYTSMIPFDGEADIEWIVKITRNSHHYSHENTVGVDIDIYGGGVPTIDDVGVVSKLEQALNDILKDYMRTYYKQLEETYTYLTSEQAFIEACECNEYLFDEAGDMD